MKNKKEILDIAYKQTIKKHPKCKILKNMNLMKYFPKEKPEKK